MEEVLEEGQLALNRLERHLQEMHGASEASGASEVSKPVSDRRMLDQVLREVRLNNRQGFGMTVEELEDRGMLGGLPFQQLRGRRTLEMHSRANRLLERGYGAMQDEMRRGALRGEAEVRENEVGYVEMGEYVYDPMGETVSAVSLDGNNSASAASAESRSPQGPAPTLKRASAARTPVPNSPGPSPSPSHADQRVPPFGPFSPAQQGPYRLGLGGMGGSAGFPPLESRIFNDAQAGAGAGVGGMFTPELAARTYPPSRPASLSVLGSKGAGGSGGGGGDEGGVVGVRVAPSYPPSESDLLEAGRVLASLRAAVLARHRAGASLRDIFRRVDRRGRGSFHTPDLACFLADLRITASPGAASLAVGMLALQGGGCVSFGEFQVFVRDPEHHLLQQNVQEQLAQIREQKGQEYASFLVHIFEGEASGEVKDGDSGGQWTAGGSGGSGGGGGGGGGLLISREAFAQALLRSGLRLTTSERDRLLLRVDVDGRCSVGHFLSMARGGAWERAGRLLQVQVEAVREAAALRAHRSGPRPEQRPPPTGLGDREAEGAALPEELVSMCEHLGIRVLSEPQLLWVAAEALRAPLPAGWTAHKDRGRTCFSNTLEGRTYEHPLDPHFRRLRDKHRESPEGAAPRGSGGLAVAVAHAQALAHSHSQTQTQRVSENRWRSPNPNSFSFGGQGASLCGPPLNQSVSSAMHPPPCIELYAATALPGEKAWAEQQRAVAHYALCGEGPAPEQQYLRSRRFRSPAQGGGVQTQPLTSSSFLGASSPSSGRRAATAPGNDSPNPHAGPYSPHASPYLPPGPYSPPVVPYSLAALIESPEYRRPLSSHLRVDRIESYVEARERMKSHSRTSHTPSHEGTSLHALMQVYDPRRPGRRSQVP